MRVNFTIDYLPELSKNRRYAFFSSKVKNNQHLLAQEMVTKSFQLALGGLHIPKQKLWVGYKWYRKTMRGDATNFLNPICDAIKKCLTFDDNYFAVSYIDWEVDKENPRIEISVEWDC